MPSKQQSANTKSQKSNSNVQITKRKKQSATGNQQPAKSRRLKQSDYKSFKLSKRLKHPKPRIVGSFRLLWSSHRDLMRNWKLFGGIALIYAILTLALVKGFGVSSNISELKIALQELISGSAGQFATSLTLFGVLLSNANSAASEVAGAYQSILLIVISLALIWSLRQTNAGNSTKIYIRDAFYKGLYPLVPFLLVLIVVSLQLLPIVFANFLYSIVFIGGLAVTPIEQGLWALMLFALVILSLYMITSSIFALYISTLPDIRPMAALKSARKLVLYRRWLIMRKVLFLPIALLVIGAAITVPIIILSATAAEWVFLALSMWSLVVVHSYMYGLYRELLKNE